CRRVRPCRGREAAKQGGLSDLYPRAPQRQARRRGRDRKVRDDLRRLSRGPQASSIPVRRVPRFCAARRQPWRAALRAWVPRAGKIVERARSEPETAGRALAAFLRSVVGRGRPDDDDDAEIGELILGDLVVAVHDWAREWSKRTPRLRR